MIRIAGFALLLLVAGCKKKDSSTGPVAPLPDRGSGAATNTPPADPTPAGSSVTDAQLDALMRDAMTYFDAIGNAIVAAGADCTRMAAGIESAVADHGELIARVRVLDADPTTEDRTEAWIQANEATAAPIFAKLGGGMQRCGSDPAVQAAVQKMGGM